MISPNRPQAERLTRPAYRSDIDGLRAIAILSVIGFHAFPDWVRGGFIGVDIFFVISGYLISTIIFDSLKRYSFSFVEFYSRRVKRIFPALILVLLASFACGWFALLPDEYEQLGKHIAAGGGFVANFAIWNESGYFDNAADTKPLLHLWSLGIEEQFYIIWPLLLWAAWKWRFNLLLITFLVATISFALNIGTSNGDVVAAFYAPHTRFWELLIGAHLAYLRVFDQSTPRASKTGDGNLPSFVGAALLAVAMSLITKERAFPGWWALLPTVGTALIISAGSQAWLNRAVLSSRVLVWFGLISYPLYLWHWPLLSFLTIVEGEKPSPELRMAAVSISIVLAWLTYGVIERPIRSRKSSTLRIATLILAMLSIGIAGFSSNLNGGYRSRQLLQDSVPERVTDQFEGPEWKYTNNQVCLTQYPFADSADYPIWFCMKSRETAPTLIILGNSSANQLYPAFALSDRLKQHSVLSIGNCDPAKAYEPDIKELIRLNPCSGDRVLHQQRFIDNLIARSRTIKYAVLDGVGESTPEYISRLKERIDFLEENGIRVIVFTPHFLPGYHPKACFARPLKRTAKDCTVPAGEIETSYKKFKPLMDSISRTNPKVLFFEQNVFLCHSGKCSTVWAGMPLYRDEYHVSEFGALELAKHFTEWAQRELPDILLNP